MPYINVGDGVRLEGAHNCCFKVKSVGSAGVRPSRNAWLFYASVRCNAHDSKSETSCNVPLTKPPCRPTDALPPVTGLQSWPTSWWYSQTKTGSAEDPFLRFALRASFYVAWGGPHSHMTLWARTCAEPYGMSYVRHVNFLMQDGRFSTGGS